MRLFPATYLLSALLLAAIAPLKAQIFTPTPAVPYAPLFVKIENGMNALLQAQAGATSAELTFYVKTGSVYENDSMSGISNLVGRILTKKISRALDSGSYGLSAANCSFSAHAGLEQTYYRFVIQDASMASCLSLLRDSVLRASISEAELAEEKKAVAAQINREPTSGKAALEKLLLREVFPKDFDKVNPQGNLKKFPFINLQAVKRFTHRYYVPNNTVTTLTGAFSSDKFQDLFYQTFNAVRKSEFDPETITKIIDFHPMIYNNQLVVADSTGAAPELQLCWQFPGTYSYRRGSYFAYLLNALLNDQNNYLQLLAQKMGCQKLQFRYEPHNFSGVLRAEVQPQKDRIAETYFWLLGQLQQLNQTLINESMTAAGKVIFQNTYDRLYLTKDYAQSVVKNWPYNDNSYFAGLKDSITSVSVKEMKQFVAEYLIENAHVSGLLISPEDREALQTDTFFTTVNDSVRYYTFTYAPNITDLEGSDNLTMRRNLLQWLRANPDVSVKVNGFSDPSEYNKAYDDTIIRYIDSIPTFRKTMPDLIAKGYLRPEMMRALKLIKYLNDNGIEQSRLSGTSMPLRSKNKQGAEANRICTIILHKARKTISLREYHYGKEP